MDSPDDGADYSAHFVYLLNLAPRYTSSAIVSLLMLLEMVIGPFWVWLGVGEQPTLIMIAGAGFVALVLTLHILRTQWFSGS